ncbi:hypothetical protein NUSPORA_02271 [Nucleospora cyclopteri]
MIKKNEKRRGRKIDVNKLKMQMRLGKLTNNKEFIRWNKTLADENYEHQLIE